MHILYPLLREIDLEQAQLDTRPLTGAPSFSWELLEEKLSDTFRTPIHIQANVPQWRTAPNLTEALGDSPFTLNFVAPPLVGQFYWIMPEQSLNTLKSTLLGDAAHPFHWQDPLLNESFCRFVALEVLYQFSTIHDIPLFAPLLLPSSKMTSVDALCFDISFQVNQHTLIGRLVIPLEFHRTWTAHLRDKGALTHNEKLAQNVEICLSIEAGRTQLKLQEWEAAQPGDFIMLDQCTLHGADLEGHILLSAHEHPVFRAKLKEGGVKILEFATYHEVKSPMSEKFEKDNQKKEIFNKKKSFEEMDFEDSLDEEESEEEEGEDLYEMAESFNEESSLEEASSHTDSSELLQDDQVEEFPVEETIEQHNGEDLSLALASAPIAPHEIPISLVIELGRIQMTIGKLLELEPGNLLNVEVNPQNGVNLVINGKITGKGELIRLGDAIGVRILELG